MSGLVTGDAVVLGLRPARLPSRALAIMLDLVVYFVGYVLISVAITLGTASMDEAAQAAIAVASFVLILVGVPIAVETLSHGRSLGKLALGLRVVRDDGGPIRFRHALVRGAMGVIELLLTFGMIAVIASLVSERGRRLGDVFGGTLVVRERVPGARVIPVPPPPPWLAGQFSGLDLSGVPDGLWLAIRQYLTRMGQLDPQVGAQMAGRLADDLVARTGAVPPPGIPAAAFLAAVVHERQSRDAARAFGTGVGAGVGVGVGRGAPAGHPYVGQPAPYHGQSVPVPGGMPGAPVASATPVAPVAPAAAAPAGTPAAPAAPPAGPVDTGRKTGFAPPA